MAERTIFQGQERNRAYDFPAYSPSITLHLPNSLWRGFMTPICSQAHCGSGRNWQREDLRTFRGQGEARPLRVLFWPWLLPEVTVFLLIISVVTKTTGC